MESESKDDDLVVLKHYDEMLAALEEGKEHPQYNYYLRLAKSHRLRIMKDATAKNKTAASGFAQSILNLLRKIR